MINTYGFEVGQKVLTEKYSKNNLVYTYKEKEIEEINNGLVKFKNEKRLHRIEHANRIGQYDIIKLPFGKIKVGDKFFIWVYENGKKRQKEIEIIYAWKPIEYFIRNLTDNIEYDDRFRLDYNTFEKNYVFHNWNHTINLHIMKRIEEEFKKGGKVTWRNKFNKKYGFDKDESHSLKDISKKSGVSMKGLQQIYNKGIGAFKNNPSSVRPNVTSKEQWAMGRVYSAVMGGKASKVDAKELKMVKGGNVSSISYEDWKNAYIYLNNEVNEKSSILQPYNFRDENVRMSEEYQKVKKDFDKSFKKLQDFNKASPKQYQKRYRDEKRASWRMVKGGNVRTREQVISDINKLNKLNISGSLSHSMYYKAYEKLRKEAESLKPYK